MRKIRSILVAALLALGMVSLGLAQTTVVSTTLSAAVASTTANSITVASATGFTAGSTAVLIDGELMNVRTVSGTTIGVTRGAGAGIGGRATTHASGAPVFVGPLGSTSPFITYDRTAGAPCTAANEPYLPQFNIANTKEFDCTGPTAATAVWSEIGGPTGIYTNVVVCGDLPNNTTNYTGAITGYSGGIFYDGTLTASDLSYSLAGTGCDAMDSTTEATADFPLYANQAFHILGMSCKVGSAGSNGVTLNLRAATANLTPNITVTIPTSSTTGAVARRTSTRIAAGATFDLRAISTEDLSASNSWCDIRVQILP